MAKTLREQLEALDAADIDAAAERAANRGPEPSPNTGEGGPVRQFLGDAIEQLGPYGKMDNMIRDRQAAQGGRQTTAQNTLGGVDKGMSFGLAGTLNAATDSLADAVRGREGPSFSDRRAQTNDLINENSNLGGEVAGAIAGGPRIAVNAADKGIRQIPRLGEMVLSRGGRGLAARATSAGTIGATEAGLYSLAQGDSLDEAQSAALFGGIFGGALQPTAEGIGAVAKLISPAFGTKADIRTGEELVDLFESAYGGDFTKQLFGQNAFDAEAVAQRVQELGREDATLLEVFPDALAATVRTMSGAPNLKVAAAARGLMDYQQNLQNRALPEFQEAIGGALGSTDIRTPEQIANQGRVLRQELEPQYDAALANTLELPQGRVTGVPIRRINAAFEDFLPSRDYGSQEPVFRRLRQLLPDVTDKRGRAAEFTPRQLLTLRKELDNIVYTGRFSAAGGMDDGVNIDREVVRNNLRPIRDAVRDMLYEVAPDVQKLDAQYGTEIGIRHAFDAGRDAGKSRAGSDLYDTFVMTSNRSPAETAAFIEGVKGTILDDLSVKSGPAAVRNYMQRAETQGRLDLVRQIVGPEAVQELVAASERLSVMRQIGRGVDNEMPSIFDPNGKGLANLGDAALMAGSGLGWLSAAIGAGAARRGVAQLGKGGTGPAAEASALSNVLTQPAQQGAEMVNQRLMDDVPQLLRGLAGFAPAGAAMGQE